MKSFKFAVFLIFVAALTACSGGGKKVLIMSSGKITVDANDNKKIKLASGTQHNEKEINLESGDAQIVVETPDGNKTFDVKEAGSYVVNLKPDTLVGGAIKYGATQNTSRIALDQLEHIIDSTRQLMEGKNASDANGTYFIPPYTSKKISANSTAKLIGPYNNIPGSVQVDKEGNGPETYKFFTNKQKRESLDDIIRQMKE